MFVWTLVLALSTFLSSDDGATARKAEDWTALFERREGWLGADGVYSFDLDYDMALGRRSSSESQSRSMWIFSDTIVGTTRNDGRDYGAIHMVNHSFGLLANKRPLERAFTFYYDGARLSDAEKNDSPRNIIPGHYWLQAGTRYGNSIWLSAILVGKAWKPERIDAATIPLDPTSGLPDFGRARVDVRAPLSYRAENAQVVLGAALCDDQDYVYIFGYVDRFREASRKDAVVARVLRQDFMKYDAWRFYAGNDRWSDRIEDLLDPDAALARNVSTEFSVSRIPTGKLKDRWLFVYTPGCISNKIAFRVAETPCGRYGDERIFYRSDIPQKLPGVRCYNAKAHPALSNRRALLVSYNVNRLGELAKRPEEYRPRFVRLAWRTIEELEGVVSASSDRESRSP